MCLCVSVYGSVSVSVSVSEYMCVCVGRRVREVYQMVSIRESVLQRESERESESE